MTIIGIKRLTLGVKKSISTLNPFSDWSSGAAQVSNTRTKEYNTPDFDGSNILLDCAASCCLDLNHVSPVRESSSPRKRLMGSLRRMRSMRSLLSLPRQEPDSQSTDSSHDPESFCTPTRQAKPSLSLNFEQSPPDKPIFDILRHERSKSSVAIHRSSPMPILSSTTQEGCPGERQDHVSPLPDGTVPSTPAPLQLVLNKDSNQLPSPEMGPWSTYTGVPAEAMSTPLPGTNLSFDIEDLGEGSLPNKEQDTVARDRSSYFALVREGKPEHSGSTKRVDVEAAVAKRLESISRYNICPRSNGAQECRPIVEMNNTGRESPCGLAVNSRGTAEVCEGIDAKLVNRPGDIRCINEQADESGSIESGQELDDIGQFLYMEYCGFDSTNDNAHYCVRPSSRVSGTYGLKPHSLPAICQTQLSIDKRSGTATKGIHDASVRLAKYLYDGAGDGNEPSLLLSPSSTFSSRSAEHIVEQAGPCAITGRCSSPVSENGLALSPGTYVEDVTPTLRDHETLEEVIRAYAAFEDERANSVTGVQFEAVSDDVIAESQADVELADRIADRSLGA